MKPRPATDVDLAHPWYVESGVFAAATEQTQYLDVLDLLPAKADAARAAVTYARDGGAVSLSGASLVFDTHDDDLPDSALTGMTSMPRILPTGGGAGLKGLVWQADGELRKIPAVLRGIARDLREAAKKGHVPSSIVPGAFVAGIVTTLFVTWIF
jgi:hypothetical protein